ncbi:MAG: hypothetical protein H6739_35125 [Alphaproteobacteria bacterium]|nr:hypothetical protein [Alphaproteobacteria bacterium]
MPERILIPIAVEAVLQPEDATDPLYHAERADLGLVESTTGVTPAPLFQDHGFGLDKGIHLMWAMPDALTTAHLPDSTPEDDGEPSPYEKAAAADSSAVPDFPRLPDRWMVVRFSTPVGEDAHDRWWTSTSPRELRVWLIDAATGTAELAHGAGADPAAVTTVDPGDLTAIGPGDHTWAAVYDNVLHRFAFHDAMAGGVRGPVSYVIIGWYDEDTDDPVYGPLEAVFQAGDDEVTRDAVLARLAELGWALAVDELSLDRVPDRCLFHGALLDVAWTAPDNTEVLADGSLLEDAWRRRRNVAAQGMLPDEETDVMLALGADETEALAALLGGEQASYVSNETSYGDLTDRQLLVEQIRMHGFLKDRLSALSRGDDGLAELLSLSHQAGFAARPGGYFDDLVPVDAAEVVATQRADDADGHLSKLALMGALAVGETSTLDGQEVRAVRRPGPRYYVPRDPVVAVLGPQRSFSRGEDDQYTDDGTLRVRLSGDVVQEFVVRQGNRDNGIVKSWFIHPTVTPDLVMGLPPAQVDCPAVAWDVVGEVALMDPTHAFVIAAQSWPNRPNNHADLESPVDLASVGQDGATPFWYFWDHIQRLQMSWWSGAPRYSSLHNAWRLRFGMRVGFDSVSAQGVPGPDPVIQVQGYPDEGFWLDASTEEAAVMPSPLALTPWTPTPAPVIAEWEATWTSSDDPMAHFALDELDFVSDGTAFPNSASYSGRTVVSAAAFDGIADRVGRLWSELAGLAQRDEIDEDALSTLREGLYNLQEQLRHYDAVFCTLNGLHDQLRAVTEDSGGLRSGRLTLTRLRLIDPFGRRVDIEPVNDAPVVYLGATMAQEAVDGWRRTAELPPRLLHPARLWFRFLDPTTGLSAMSLPSTSPVCGYLLPDHIDRALEVFDVNGASLGQLRHANHGVMWEPPPGVDAPAGQHPPATDNPVLAGVLDSLIAWGAREQADAAAGAPPPLGVLEALMGVIDSTFWTINPFGHGEDEHLALMLGRPLALVRAELRLEIEADDVRYDEAPPAALSRAALEVRLGALTRREDGLVGYFLNEDYSRFYPVFGQRALQNALGRVEGMEALVDVLHPFIEHDHTLTLRKDQTIRVTMLMHPLAAVHATMGLLPQKALRLVRAHVHAALSAMRPSFALGPVLTPPDEVSLTVPGGEVWSWSEREVPGRWVARPVTKADDRASYPDHGPLTREGWLVLST